jgi:hypothetical protein
MEPDMDMVEKWGLVMTARVSTNRTITARANVGGRQVRVVIVRTESRLALQRKIS